MDHFKVTQQRISYNMQPFLITMRQELNIAMSMSYEGVSTLQYISYNAVLIINGGEFDRN